MRLSDLRRVAVRQNLRIRFPLAGGQECLLDEHGVARVPGGRAAADYNLEEQLAAAERFTVESPGAQKPRLAARQLSRQELATLAGGQPEAPHAEPE